MKRLATKISQTGAKNFHTSCGPLSVKGYVKMPNGTIHGSGKKFAMRADQVLDMAIARDSLKYQSIVTQMCCLPQSAFGHSSTLSIAMMSGEGNARKWCDGCLSQYRLLFCTQLSQLTILV